MFVRTGRIWHLHVWGKLFCTTGEHPFFVRGKSWVPAQELQPGDLLCSHDGQWVVVDESYDTGEYETVYNCRVAEWHTYFIGDDNWNFSVWAHNTYTDAVDPKTGQVTTAVDKQREVAEMLHKLGTSQEFAKKIAVDYAATGKPGDTLHAMLELISTTVPVKSAGSGVKPTTAEMESATHLLMEERHSFHLVDKTKGGIEVWGIVEDGKLTFGVRAETKGSRERGTLSGQFMFDKMMKHFQKQGTAIDVINGSWSFESNIAMFNLLTKAGLTNAEAAAGTATGRWAAQHGYTDVARVTTAPKGAGIGNYSAAYAEFHKPSE